MASARPITDHDEIREWAEDRGARPACVKGTGGKNDTGMIRLRDAVLELVDLPLQQLLDELLERLVEGRPEDDVALVGYDDSAIARHMDPPLTSVRQPIEEMGRRMLDLLLTEIADSRPAASRGLERRQVVLATELMARASA